MDEKKLIKKLGFSAKENTLDIFYKKYNGYLIEIDFCKNSFNFGEKISAGRETTQNFSQTENWVVLECVDRLLEKGYKPENIVLEKKYTVGHGASGGWLDILVTRDDGTAYLMIECKTWGKEFEKEFKKLNKDGGQLFTYFQQDKLANVLMLYTSKLDNDKILYKNEIVKIEEHYRQAGNVEDVFDRWNKICNDNGIFDDWVKPYLFENKKLTKKDLQSLTEEDSSKIFHEFSSILRKHSVSDKPNAFNKIFNLFLAKIFDEKKKDNVELEFQWKEHSDNAVDFQVRLINLYKLGMKDFLDKEIKGISNDMFRYETDEELLERKKHILLFDKIFDIKEVFDDETFEDNHRVLKEVVQLLQKYQIRYPRKQQHLSDFFERLLTTGLKQEAGQFFTPPPITRFIIRSLPISQYIKKQLNQDIPELPAVIDYSVGSGHFLTEVMEEYQRVIDQDIDIAKLKTQEADDFVEVWRKKKYDWASQYIYGIEKDYRLVKVAKVGCYFYGDGLAQVIHGDGLDNFKHSNSYRGLLRKNSEKPQFSFIVSNPPYSVSSFKGDLKNTFASKDFELFDSLTDRSSEIECLFIERTKQLLKIDGIASVILPSSILSNSGIYTKAREIILKSFDIVAITELGSNTFMATGTNTVILFLKRREDNLINVIQNSINQSIAEQKDNTIKGAKNINIEKPISKYIDHTWESILFKDYISLFQKNPNENIKQHEIFKEYEKKITAKNKDKISIILELEKEKLLYFILAYNQKVVLVKTGQKNKEKQFLGYEFSNRRGNEGMHPIQRGQTVDECTSLYDINDFTNPKKASSYIYKAFTENNFDCEIPENLKENISYQNLVDMLTFDRADFEKTISLNAKKKLKIESKWEVVNLGKLVSTQYGYTDKATDTGTIRYLRITDLNDDGSIKLDNESVFITPTEDIKQQFLLENNDIVIARSGSVGKSAMYILDKYEPMIFASYLIRLKPMTDSLLEKYLFYFTKTSIYWNQVDFNSVAVTQPNLNAEKIKSFKIPLPPLEIQQKIVDEIEVLEKEETLANDKIEELKKNINHSLLSLSNHDDVFLNEVAKIQKGTSITKAKTISGDIPVIAGGKEPAYYHNQANRESNVITVSASGVNAGYLNYFETPIFASDCNTIISKDQNIISTKLIYNLLKIKQDLIYSLQKGQAQPHVYGEDLANIKIPLPPLSEQKKIVAEIEKIEKQISELENTIANIPQQKEQILKKYL